jgi:hypothetical protein
MVWSHSLVRMTVWPSAVFALLAQASVAVAQDAAEGPARKVARAVAVGEGTIRLDGRLDDEPWLRAPPMSDFTQKEPVEGDPPVDRMDVRFVYDGNALYVGARMFTSASSAVQAPLGRRDNGDQSEHIHIWLDTYLDRRSAAMFGVTASGVRLDRFHATDNETSFDTGFDPVWQARTSVDVDGWTAELWIPFSQLRFTPQTDQTWGVNVRRFRPTIDEETYWVLVPRTERVFISRFGDLRGITGVRPTRRIELLPYVAGASTLTGDEDPGNPFDDGTTATSRVGVDAKMGLGPNLTLEATMNPDFGQVEADPAEVNLTAFETRFPERRPFFLEGATLLNVGHPNLYYSRRIGARPAGAAPGDFVDYPSDSTIVAAAKLTGRLPSRTSIAVLSAVTGGETARTAMAGSPLVQEVRVAPTAYYNVGRVRQEFGTLGSSVGFFVSAVHRDLSAGEPLAALLTRNAFAAAADAQLRFKDGEYEMRTIVGGSYVGADAAAIERIQRSSAHYAQRPDRTYSRLDPTLTSLGGWTVYTNFDRTGGRHWLFGGSVKVDSENFETNDLANLNGADAILVNTNIRYRETEPGRLLRNYTIALNQSNDSTLRGLRQVGFLRPSITVTWANFWTSSVQVSRNFSTTSVSLTRGGPTMTGPPGWTTVVNVGNRPTSNTRWSGSLTVSTNEDGGERQRYGASVSLRPGPRWQFSATPYYETLTEAQQYVATVAGGRDETYGSRYVFAFIDRTTTATEFRLGFTVRPDLNLDVYAEPFAASGRYYDFGELLAPGGRARRTYGLAPDTAIATAPDGRRSVTVDGQMFTLPTRDFNTLSMRSNVVLRWEWRPGSTLYVVWQQDRSETEVIPTRVNVGDMFRSLTAPGRNAFVVKTTFWIPIR